MEALKKRAISTRKSVKLPPTKTSNDFNVKSTQKVSEKSSWITPDYIQPEFKNIPLLRRAPLFSNSNPARPSSANPNDLNHQFAELKLKEIELEKNRNALVREAEREKFKQKEELFKQSYQEQVEFIKKNYEDRISIIDLENQRQIQSLIASHQREVSRLNEIIDQTKQECTTKLKQMEEEFERNLRNEKESLKDEFAYLERRLVQKNTFEKEKAFDEATHVILQEKSRIEHEFKVRREQDLNIIIDKLAKEYSATNGKLKTEIEKIEAENKNLKARIIELEDQLEEMFDQKSPIKSKVDNKKFNLCILDCNEENTSLNEPIVKSTYQMLRETVSELMKRDKSLEPNNNNMIIS